MAERGAGLFKRHWLLALSIASILVSWSLRPDWLPRDSSLVPWQIAHGLAYYALGLWVMK